MTFKKILNIAHRGFSKKFPENTLIAFQEALNLGVDMIELDVHLSKDRQVVVHHDDELGRTNDGQGRLKDYTLRELKSLDAGSWFDQKFSGETIPLLEEVLALVTNQTRLNIEIKAAAYEEEEPADGIEQQVAALVQKKGIIETTIVSSFQANCLRRMNRLPAAPQVALLDYGKGRNLDLIAEIRPFSYHTFYRRLTVEEVDQVHQAGLPLYVFTVNTLEDMETMIQMGVDGIITNSPDVLKQRLQVNE